MPYRDEYRTQRATLERRVVDGDVDEETARAIKQLCDAFDPEIDRVPLPDAEEYRAVKTLDMYTRRLRLVAERFDGDMIDTTAEALNEEMQRWYDGTHPAVDDGGLAENTISNYQGPLRVFYRYHDFGVVPEEIEITTPNGTAFDPDDMLSDDELQRIRNCIDSARNRAVFEFLLNTGIRNTAARTVTISDIDLREGVFHLNEGADGLKGAADRGTKRPLLGAEPAVREWLRDHPDSGNADAYLITNRPESPHLDPTTPVSHTHLGKLLREVKRAADVDKPLHPHALRHNFVTRAKRDYGMDDATIKYLIGHPPESRVMERTYQHVSAETHVEDAVAAAGIREDSGRTGFTPESCFGCGLDLNAGADSCPSCGTLYSPMVGFESMEVNRSPAPRAVIDALLADEEFKRQLVSAVSERLGAEPDVQP